MMDKTKITKMTLDEFRLSKEAEDSAAEAAETAARKIRDTPYWEFIEKIKNPPNKCVMHQEAVNAANLIEMWRGIAETLYFAILETAGGEGIDAYNWAWGEEQRIINSKVTQ